MGKSSFFEGDMDLLRVYERVSVIINDIFFGNSVIGFRNEIVDGFYLRIESYVDLGVVRGVRFYDILMKFDFKAVLVLYKKVILGLIINSSILLDYYSKWKMYILIVIFLML